MSAKRQKLLGEYLYRPDDSPTMRNAIEEIIKAGYTWLKRPSPYQLKVDGVSYYPDRQTVLIDGLPKQKARGLQELFRVLKKQEPLELREVDVIIIDS